ncbi:ATP-binding protein, partial [Kistimonas scapharcae]|uniref:ATP-binding protein n=1 Tax=Kistimonas scapharcae TaxID=1036133 RepID=UPI0031EFC89C
FCAKTVLCCQKYGQLAHIPKVKRDLRLILLIAIIVIAFIQEYWITRPLMQLVDASRHYARGAYDTPLPHPGPDEVGDLIGAFDKMRLKLREREMHLYERNERLRIVTALQKDYIRGFDDHHFHACFLADLMHLSESGCGYLAQVQEDGGHSALHYVAVKCRGDGYETMNQTGHELSPMDTVNCHASLRHAMSSGRQFIDSDCWDEPQRFGFPAGFPAVESVAVIPLVVKNQVMAIVCLANRERGFQEHDIETLQAVLQTGLGIFEAINENRLREIAETNLAAREAYLRAILDSVVAGIITLDEQGCVMTSNGVAEQLFDCAEGAVIGHDFSRFLYRASSDDRHEDRAVMELLNAMQQRQHLITHKYDGVKPDGARFPMELTVTRLNEAKDNGFCVVIRDLTLSRELDRLKGEFIANVNHELRTPLTTIKSALGLLSSGAVMTLTESAQHIVQMASDSLDRLLAMVVDMLAIEQIENGQMQFHMTRVDLVEVLEEACSLNRVLAEKCGVVISNETTQASCYVQADHKQLVHAFTNVVSNACKFSQSGQRVEVSITVEDGVAHVVIVDHGVGMPDTGQGEMLDKFTQSDGSAIRRFGGVGLGLTITNAIVKEHDGVMAFDTTPRGGTTVTISLPMRACVLQQVSA